MLKSLNICITVAIIYIVTGYLGLHLAVPPGYATTVWPPSGIAIAALLLFGYPALFGTFFGSMTLNVLLSVDNLTPLPIFSSLPVAIPIAMGSSIQAFVGVYFIRKIIGYPNKFLTLRDVLLFSLIAGPITCICAPSIGVATLYLNGVVSLETWFTSWIAWWTGDSIGALVFAPVVLVMLSPVNMITFRRKYISCLSFLIVFVIAILVFLWSKSSEKSRIENQFNKDILAMNDHIEQRLHSAEHSLNAFKGLYAASSFVDKMEFTRFFEYVAKKDDSLQLVSWLKYLTHEQRLTHTLNPKNKDIWTVKEGVRVPAPKAEVYFPITYNALKGSRMDVFGYDPYTDLLKKQAMDRAWNDNAIYASTPVKLIARPLEGYTSILFVPIFGSEIMSSEQGEGLLGFIASIFYLDKLGQMLLALNSEIQVRITDNAGQAELVVYDSVVSDNDVLHGKRDVDFSGRNWKIDYFATVNYQDSIKDTISVWVLTGSMIFVWLFTIAIFLVTGYEENIRNKVDSKTKQLNEALMKAYRANKAKSNFIASMSHELRTPLNSIIGFTKRLMKEKSISDLKNNKIDIGLDAINRNGTRLLNLINDLLDISKIESGKMTLNIEPTNLSSIIEAVTTTVTPLVEEKNLALSIDKAIYDISIELDVKKVHQVILNLISNAIKYTHRGSIYLSGYFENFDEVHGVTFKVEDTGQGIADTKIDKLFIPYSQIENDHDSAIEGTGLGLSLVKELVELHKGRVWVESKLGEGSRFYFWLPSKHSVTS